MADDYYRLLGVSKSATAEEIQKGYRKQARKYHPDLHGDVDESEKKKIKQKFQEIQHAYDVLSDPEKRKMYDQFGPQFEQMAGAGGHPFGQQAGGGHPFGPGGIDLSQLFGGGGGGAGFEDIFRQMGGAGGPRAGQRPPARGQDLEQQITVPFAVAVKGGRHQLAFTRQNGKQERIDVTIPAGIEDGKKIRLRGQGHPGPGGPAGDLLIVVHVAPHPRFRRRGLNLLVDVPISLMEAAEGAKIDVPSPHGTVSVKVPQGTSSGKTLRLKGMGIKAKDRSGDLMVTLEIRLPEEISDQDREILEQLGGPWKTVDRSDIKW